MGKDERILKKIGKLLLMYGVSEEEKNKFLADVEDEKYDDQEEINEPIPEEVEEAPIDEPMETETQEVEEPVGEEVIEEESAPIEEEGVPQEEIPQEEVQPEPPMEEAQPIEDVPPTEPQPQEVDWQGKYEELQKSVDGLKAMVDKLNDALTQSGVLVSAQEPTINPVGVEHNDPAGNPITQDVTSVLGKLNR